jgi:hypothetical protein
MQSGFPYTLRATGHENALAFELIAKNGMDSCLSFSLQKKS